MYKCTNAHMFTYVCMNVRVMECLYCMYAYTCMHEFLHDVV